MHRDGSCRNSRSRCRYRATTVGATAAAPLRKPQTAVDTEFLKAELKRLNAELKEVQGENPLMQPVVNGQSVAEVISGWTGIPIGKMVADEINAVLNLHETLG